MLTFYTIFRESSDPQERKKGLVRQQRQVRRFAETWPDGPHRIYEPHAQVIESASQGSRREWEVEIEKGIELFRKRLIDAFVFPEVDRETRNPLISVPILRRVLDSGIPVFFAEESLLLDPDDPRTVNRYSEAVAKSCAYVDVFVQKTRAGRFDRADQDHLLPSNTKMFGFDIIDGKKVVNPAQAAALRQAGEIILREGRSGPAARWLNEQGWHTTHGKPFSSTTLACRNRGIFWNRALIGETVVDFKEKQVVICHEGIFDETKFEAIKAVLAAFGLDLAPMSPEASLWPSRANDIKGLTSGTFYGNLQRYFLKAGITPAGVHIFRHTAAKLRRDVGETIEDVSRFLDHSSLAVTTVYLRRLEGEKDRSWAKVAEAIGV